MESRSPGLLIHSPPLLDKARATFELKLTAGALDSQTKGAMFSSTTR